MTWATFVRVARMLDVGDGMSLAYLFRGHASADWVLEPTLQRATSLNGTLPLPTAEKLLSLEERVTQRFIQEAPLHLPPAVQAATKADVDWWTVMRHYGTPTRLLDWTESPFVAAYFACSSEPSRPGSIYYVHASSLRSWMRERHGRAVDWKLHEARTLRQLRRPDSPGILEFYQRKTALPARMIAQRGVFMHSRNPATDIEAELEEAHDTLAEGSDLLGKLIIEPERKEEFMAELRRMNITGASLFPGLDGIGRSLDEALRIARRRNAGSANNPSPPSDGGEGTVGEEP